MIPPLPPPVNGEGIFGNANRPLRLRGGGGEGTFLLILATGLILRLLFVFTTPLYPAKEPHPGYNDEPMHLQYVRYIAEVKSWPIWYQAESDVDSLVDEYPQPPLYYLTAVPFFKLFGLYGARLVSLFFGLLSALVVYSGTKLFFDDKTALSAFAFAMLTPNPVTFSSLVTNDSLLACLAAMSFVSLFLSRRGDGGAVRQIKTGLILGAAIWAKMSAIALLPLAFLAAPPILPRTDAWIARWRVIFIALLVALPLIAWNLSHYGQAVPTVSIYTPEDGHSPGSGVEHPLAAVKHLLRSAAQPIQEVWGGPVEISLSIIWVLIVMLAIGYGLWHLRNHPSRLLIFGGILLPLASLIYYNIDFFQVEARLLAPALFPLSLAAGVGANQLKVPLWAQCILWSAPLAVFLAV